MSTNDAAVKPPAITTRAWNVGKIAIERAKARRDPVVDSRHIFYALVAEADGLAAVVLREFGVDEPRVAEWLSASAPDEDLGRVVRVEPEAALSAVGIELEAVRARTDELFGADALGDVEVNPPLGDNAIEIFARSQDEALALGHNYIGTEHLLLAFTAPAGSTGVRRLRELGLDDTAVRGRVLQTVERFHVAIDDDRYRELTTRAQRLRDLVDQLPVDERKRARPTIEALDHAIWQQWAALYPNPVEPLFEPDVRARFLDGIGAAVDAAAVQLDR